VVSAGEAELIDREMMRILIADLASRHLKVRFESVKLLVSWGRWGEVSWANPTAG
jgi:hypothetical protein